MSPCHCSSFGHREEGFSEIHVLGCSVFASIAGRKHMFGILRPTSGKRPREYLGWSTVWDMTVCILDVYKVNLEALAYLEAQEGNAAGSSKPTDKTT
jgi:hypothetical protein